MLPQMSFLLSSAQAGPAQSNCAITNAAAIFAACIWIDMSISQRKTIDEVRRSAGSTTKRLHATLTRTLSAHRSLGFAARPSTLPHAVTFLAQPDCELDLHLARAFIRHRIAVSVQ